MLKLKNEYIELVNDCEKELLNIYSEIDKQTLINSKKVLDAFRHNEVSTSSFSSTTGYGYDDLGREKIEKVYSEIFKSEDALVRTQFISGTHALTVGLFGLLRPNDTLLSITGKPYDTLDEVIGLIDNPSSLKSYGVNYKQIDLVNNDFNYDEIKKALLEDKSIKVIEIQRSKGYSTRKTIVIDKLEKVIKFISYVF